MMENAKAKPRGLLNPRQGQKHFLRDRMLPAPDLAHLIEHFWSAEWSLRPEAPYCVETLPHPSVHLIVEKGRSQIVGVMRRRFSRSLEGDGRVFGMKFLPGAFHAIYGKSVKLLTDRSVAAMDFFGSGWLRFERHLLLQPDSDAKVKVAEDFLRQLQVTVSNEALLVRRTIETTLRNPTILKVDSLCEMFSLKKRQLQRLFGEYAGVSPKWVIDRYRMHEAVERLSSDHPPDLATLALSLGYFDQAHFQKAFRSVIGKSPGEYASKLL